MVKCLLILMVTFSHIACMDFYSPSLTKKRKYVPPFGGNITQCSSADSLSLAGCRKKAFSANSSPLGYSHEFDQKAIIKRIKQHYSVYDVTIGHKNGDKRGFALVDHLQSKEIEKITFITNFVEKDPQEYCVDFLKSVFIVVAPKADVKGSNKSAIVHLGAAEKLIEGHLLKQYDCEDLGIKDLIVFYKQYKHIVESKSGTARQADEKTLNESCYLHHQMYAIKWMLAVGFGIVIGSLWQHVTVGKLYTHFGKLNV